MSSTARSKSWEEARSERRARVRHAREHDADQLLQHGLDVQGDDRSVLDDEHLQGAVRAHVCLDASASRVPSGPPCQGRRARASTFLPNNRRVALSMTRLSGNTTRSNSLSDVPLGSPEASPMNL